MLFYFLRCDEAPEVQLAALSVIVDITSIKDCVASIAESGVMSNILILIEQCPQGHELALEALHALSSNTKIVGELLLKGALLFLLNMFCSSRSPGVRLTVATVFARMAADKLNGPRVTIQLAKFLPPIFMDAMRENAEASVHMFESNQENPELVWDESSRKRVQTEVARMQKLSYEEQLVNATSYKFVLPENFEVTKRRLADVLYSKNIFFFFFFVFFFGSFAACVWNRRGPSHGRWRVCGPVYQAARLGSSQPQGLCRQPHRVVRQRRFERAHQGGSPQHFGGGSRTLGERACKKEQRK